jgi:ferredoxin-NADP reductase
LNYRQQHAASTRLLGPAHIDLVLPGGLTRQHSLCGDRWDAYSYRIAVLREPNGRGASAYIHDSLREGDIVGFGVPRNNFRVVSADQYMFLAGGIGITPLPQSTVPLSENREMLGGQRWQVILRSRV